MLENDRYYLSLIIHHCSDALECCSEYTYEMFNKDKRTKALALMSLMLIGEYSKKLSDSFKKEYDYIPWREIIDQRNFVVHDYGDLDFTIIWDTINDNILELKDFCNEILNEE